MTRYDAMKQHLPPGFAIRLDITCGLTVYLADFRRSKFMTTSYPNESEYFQRFLDAQEMAGRISHATGQPWVACTVPTSNPIHWDQHENGHTSDCRCSEFVRFRDGRTLNVTEYELARENAIEDELDEAIGELSDRLSDEDFATIARAFHLPGNAPRHPTP